jgi:hypothetical protein
MEASSENLALPNYKTISPWAIAAFLIGLAAPLALVSLLLWVVPLLGVALGVNALRSIRLNREQFSGDGLAWCGLFLSLFMLVYVPARMTLRNRELQTHAAVLSDKVLELIQQQQLHEVHQLVTRQFISRDRNRPLVDYYSEDPKNLEVFQRFIDGEGIKKINECKGDFKYQRELIETFVGDTNSDNFLVRYRIQPGEQQHQASFPLWITVERQRDLATGEITWWFRTMRLDDPAKQP